MDRAIEKFGLDFEQKYNVAICGQTGSGKSTMINGLRFLPDTHPNAARVGVNECTAEMKDYPFPNLDHLVLWDCPGAGTQRHPLKTYFLDKFLFAFDWLVFVYAKRRGIFVLVREKSGSRFKNVWTGKIIRKRIYVD